MSNWPDNLRNILNVGVPLFNININNWALSKGQALDVIQSFLLLKIPILGGDVYEISNGTFQSNYDSWYCDKNENEEHLTYVQRSYEKAQAFINNYSQDNFFYFAVVPDF